MQERWRIVRLPLDYCCWGLVVDTASEELILGVAATNMFVSSALSFLRSVLLSSPSFLSTAIQPRLPHLFAVDQW